MVGEPDAKSVVGRLAVQRRRGVELLARERLLQEVLVVLEDVELEPVLLEDADAVQVPLGQVLEPARLLPELEQDLVAVESALALARRLVLVGDLLDEALRG